MTEALDHKTFDLGAVLAGIGYPEKTFPVWFDERIGWQIYEATEYLRTAEIRGNEQELAAAYDELDKLKESAKNTCFKVTVRGLPESTIKACNAKAEAKYPVDYNMIGQPTPNSDRDDMFNTLLWIESIVKIENPKGEVNLPDEKTHELLRTKTGRSVVSTISNAINELIQGTSAGFESAAREVSFLSDASPEE